MSKKKPSPKKAASKITPQDKRIAWELITVIMLMLAFVLIPIANLIFNFWFK